MKIYKISQEEQTGYDTYDSAIVVAENEEEARNICPSEFHQFVNGVCIWKPLSNPEQENPDALVNTWAKRIQNVKVEYLGEAKKGSKKGLIVSSFNAG